MAVCNFVLELFVLLRSFSLISASMSICGPRIALMFSLFAFADAGEMPDIHIQYENESEGVAGMNARRGFATRASQLAAAIEQTDLRISQVSSLVGQASRAGDRNQLPSSFLSSRLQPVDASRMRKSLAATEPMASPAGAAVNVIVAEDVGGMANTAKHKGTLDQISRLEDDFNRDIAELLSGA